MTRLTRHWSSRRTALTPTATMTNAPDSMVTVALRLPRSLPGGRTYAKPAHISEIPMSVGKFCTTTFGLDSLTNRDGNSNGTADPINLTQDPNPAHDPTSASK